MYMSNEVYTPELESKNGPSGIGTSLMCMWYVAACRAQEVPDKDTGPGVTSV